MRSGAIFFLAGIMLVQQFASLPPLYWCVPVLPLFILWLWRRHMVYLLCFCFALGFSWAMLHAHYHLQHRLVPELISKDILLAGWITGIPQSYSRYVRFEFKVDEKVNQAGKFTLPKHLQLSWYGKNIPELTAGDYWQLQVRLKPPVGTFNPGGFDYEKYLFQKRIHAKGYVRKSKLNHILPGGQQSVSLDRLRQTILTSLKKIIGEHDNASLVYALVIGDRTAMSAEQWRVLRDSGTAHLMAISGLHIGFVAVIGFWLGRWCWSYCGTASLLISAHKVGAVVAVSFALAYALLAGWSIPTQRAFIMVMVVMTGLVFYRNLRTSQVLALALFAVLFYDPLSVLSAGFWLSFAAVTVIACAMSGVQGSMGKIKQWGYVQWSISLGLLPLLLLFFQQVSLIAPVANLWAIPLLSVLVVPLVLLAVPCLFFMPSLASGLLNVSILVIDGIWWVLDKMLYWSLATWQVAEPRWWMVMFSVLGIALLLTPRGFPARNIAAVFFLPLFFPLHDNVKHGEAGFHLLDVGQGLSAVIQTQQHVLVFDTGPRLSERFDSGDMIVLPFLRQLGISKLDVLLVSHEDNDHIGGAHAILKQMPVEKIITSAPAEFARYHNVIACQPGQAWQWDGVDFEILHPVNDFTEQAGKRRDRNNRSCVLRVSNDDQSILLSADIEKQAEYSLVEELGEKLASDVLVVPHHGSRTSSSERFLEKVKPQLALLPAGYLNRYRLPSKTVLHRYQQRQTSVLSTALEGAISLKLLKNHPIQVTRYRRKVRRYWHYPRK